MHIGMRVRVKFIIKNLKKGNKSVPWNITMTCEPNPKSPMCKRCPHSAAQKHEIESSYLNNNIISFINNGRKEDRAIYKNVFGIPPHCQSCGFEESSNRLNILPGKVDVIVDMTGDESGSAHESSEMITYFYDCNPNLHQRYQADCVVTFDPTTKDNVLIAYNLMPLENHYTSFQTSPEVEESLKIFQPEDNSYEALEKKWEDIQHRLKVNVHKMKGRPDMFNVVDTVIHSMTQLKFQGEVYAKGWMEAAIVGDSSIGKSYMLKKLLGFYGIGEIVDSRAMTTPGLIGAGFQDREGCWDCTAGILGMYDRNLIMFDECQGKHSILNDIKEIRSSGEGKIRKAGNPFNYPARNRKFFLANPTSKRVMKQFAYGHLALFDIFPDPSNIRRLDIAVMLSNQDRLEEGKFVKIENIYTQELSRTLINFIYSRTHEHIVYEEGVEDYIEEEADKLRAIYECENIPLIDRGETHLKLARGSIAIAGRTASIKGENIIIQKRHVDFYINHIIHATYDPKESHLSRKSFKEYVAYERRINMTNPQETLRLASQLLYAANSGNMTNAIELIDLVYKCNNNGAFTASSLKDIWDNHEAVGKVMRILITNHLIEIQGRGTRYQLTPKGDVVIGGIVNKEIDLSKVFMKRGMGHGGPNPYNKL